MDDGRQTRGSRRPACWAPSPAAPACAASCPIPCPGTDVTRHGRAGRARRQRRQRQTWRFVAVEDAALRAAPRDAVSTRRSTRWRRGRSSADRRQARSRRCAPTPPSSPTRRWSWPSSPCRTVARRRAARAPRPVTGASAIACGRRPDLQSIGAAVQLLCTAAHALGYGSCWMTAPVLAAPAIERLLGVDAAGGGSWPLVPVGRPAGRPTPSSRRPLDDVLELPVAARRRDLPALAAGLTTACQRALRDATLARRGPGRDRTSPAATVTGRTRPVDHDRCASPALCARALAGEPLGEAELEALLLARGEDARPSSPPRATCAPATSATRSSSTASSTSRRTVATTAPSASTAPATTRARATASRSMRSSPSVAGSPARASRCSTSPWARTRCSTTSRATSGLLELVRRGREGRRTARHGLARPRAGRRARRALGRRGADWYALYQETHTPELYDRLRVGQAIRGARRRPQCGPARRPARRGRHPHGRRRHDRRPRPLRRRDARRGLPAGARDDVRAAGGHAAGRTCRRRATRAELLTIAVMRLAMPDRLIPASLDVDGIRGLERRLQAGANVVTSIVPPAVRSGRRVAGRARHRRGSPHRRRRAAAPRAARSAGGVTPPSTRSGCDARVSRGRTPGTGMRLLVVGGKLQGTEACYLAAKAGYETVLVDRRPAPPAAGLAARHVVADITADEALARTLVRSCDAVLPACEDEATLTWLAEHVPALGRAAAVRPRRLPGDAVQAAPRSDSSTSSTCRVPAVAGLRLPGRGQAGRGERQRGRGVVHDDDALAAARRRLEAAGHIVLSSRSTCRARRSPSRCSCWDGRGRAAAGDGTGVRRRLRLQARRGPGGCVRRRHAGRPAMPSTRPPYGSRRASACNGLMDVEVDGRRRRARRCSRSTPGCPARRRRRCTGRAASTSSSC